MRSRALCCCRDRWGSASSGSPFGSDSGSSVPAPSPRPCGSCQHCRYAVAGTHPDIHWYFPRPRLKDSDPSPEDVEDDFRDAVAERTKTGVYPPPPPEDAILIATIRAMAHSAALLPALGARKVYVLGDADRLVVREDSELAAGAFLKLLEEPPPRATIVLTSSEPGALIRRSVPVSWRFASRRSQRTPSRPCSRSRPCARRSPRRMFLSGWTSSGGLPAVRPGACSREVNGRTPS
jgi:hypothetical protein